jgi:outer membrane lipoprotein SlyB
MVRNAAFASLGLLIAAVAGCASGESYTLKGFDFSKVEKVAVLEVTGPVATEAARNQLGDFFVMELLKKGYVPVERQQVQAILKEQKFESSGATSDEDAARAGRILNVPAVVIINIPEYGEYLSMTIKMVETETARIVWMGAGRGSTGRMPLTVGGALLGAAAGAALGGSRAGRVVGGGAGAVGGGLMGEALSPEESRVVQKVITKIASGLPSR